eukprot:1317001-Pyramimonas_sp.AAC.1
MPPTAPPPSGRHHRKTGRPVSVRDAEMGGAKARGPKERGGSSAKAPGDQSRGAAAGCEGRPRPISAAPAPGRCLHQRASRQ